MSYELSQNEHQHSDWMLLSFTVIMIDDSDFESVRSRFTVLTEDFKKLSKCRGHRVDHERCTNVSRTCIRTKQCAPSKSNSHSNRMMFFSAIAFLLTRNIDSCDYADRPECDLTWLGTAPDTKTTLKAGNHLIRPSSTQCTPARCLL